MLSCGNHEGRTATARPCAARSGKFLKPGLLAIALAGEPAAAEAMERRWYATGYASRWANTDILDVPERTFSGRLSFRDANFAGVGLGRVLVPSFAIPVPWTDFAFRGNRIEVEAQVLRHFGGQDHWEGVLALMFRTGQIPLMGGLSMNLALGEGFSYASERPRLEGSFRVEPSRFLNYLAFEAEFSHASLPGVQLVSRIHHRSGVFGVIAPKESGSNYVGIGLRFDLR